MIKGDCTNVKAIDDRRDFTVVQQALSVLGFSGEECQVRLLTVIMVFSCYGNHMM